MTTYAFAEILAAAEAATEQFEYEAALEFYSQLLATTNGASADPVEQGSRLKAFSEQGRILQNLNRNDEARAIYEACRLEAGPGTRFHRCPGGNR